MAAITRARREIGDCIRPSNWASRTSLLGIAASAFTPFEVASDVMVGPLIYGFSEDAVAAAKVITDFAKANDKLVIKGGAYAGKALTVDGVKALASIPSREVLISQVAGLLKSPIQRFAAVLAAVVQKQSPATAEPADAAAEPAAA